MLGMVGALLLFSGTGAFTSVATERTVSVQVVDDPNAFLGVEYDAVRIDNGDWKEPGARTNVTLLTVRNQFVERIRVVRVSVKAPDAGTPPKLQAYSAPEALATGESGDVTARVACGNANDSSERWQVRLRIEGDGTSVELTRTITVECTGNAPG